MDFGTYLLLAVEFFLLFAIIAVCIYLFTGFIGVPWVPTRKLYRDAMFSLAQIQPGERVLDIGAGDGIILCDAAKRFQAKGIGIESHGILILASKLRALCGGVSDQTEFLWGNMYKIDYPEVDVVLTYLFPEANARLEPRLIEAYPSGTRVVARAFKFPTLPLMKKIQVGTESMYLYQIP